MAQAVKVWEGGLGPVASACSPLRHQHGRVLGRPRHCQPYTGWPGIGGVREGGLLP